MTKILMALALIAGIGYTQWQRAGLDSKRAAVLQESSELRAQNEQRIAGNKRLKARIRDVRENTDAAFEELAREKLFMVKEGEIYVLPQGEAQP